MAITASLVKELRERTGAGMMDCKKALTATDGDMDKAIDYLREKGLSKAAKKASRVAAEGIVDAYVDEANKIAVLLEVNCETDFVANTDDYKTWFCPWPNTSLPTNRLMWLNGKPNLPGH